MNRPQSLVPLDERRRGFTLLPCTVATAVASLDVYLVGLPSGGVKKRTDKGEGLKRAAHGGGPSTEKKKGPDLNKRC